MVSMQYCVCVCVCFFATEIMFTVIKKKHSMLLFFLFFSFFFYVITIHGDECPFREHELPRSIATWRNDLPLGT